MAYRWLTPHDWLLKRIGELVGRGDFESLAHDLRDLADLCPGDTIQSVFLTDMENDGFFTDPDPNRK